MCENRKKGDLAEVKAIMKFTDFEFLVSRPVTHSSHYDLIIDVDNKVYRIEVKSTTKKTRSGYYYIDTRSFSKKLYKRLDPVKTDFVLVIDGDDNCYLIDASFFESRSYMTLNEENHERFHMRNKSDAKNLIYKKK